MLGGVDGLQNRALPCLERGSHPLEMNDDLNGVALLAIRSGIAAVRGSAVLSLCDARHEASARDQRLGGAQGVKPVIIGQECGVGVVHEA